MSSSCELAPSAYAVLFMHCTKYPHRTLNGLLLGAEKPGGGVSVREALPLFHSSLDGLKMVRPSFGSCSVCLSTAPHVNWWR